MSLSHPQSPDILFPSLKGNQCFVFSFWGAFQKLVIPRFCQGWKPLVLRVSVGILGRQLTCTQYRNMLHWKNTGKPLRSDCCTLS